MVTAVEATRERTAALELPKSLGAYSKDGIALHYTFMDEDERLRLMSRAQEVVAASATSREAKASLLELGFSLRFESVDEFMGVLREYCGEIGLEDGSTPRTFYGFGRRSYINLYPAGSTEIVSLQEKYRKPAPVTVSSEDAPAV